MTKFSALKGAPRDGVLPEFVTRKILKCSELPARYKCQLRRPARSADTIPLFFEGCAAYSDMISEFAFIMNRCVPLLINDVPAKFHLSYTFR